jgi:ABC-type uncharacterized transport system permease subunit
MAIVPLLVGASRRERPNVRPPNIVGIALLAIPIIVGLVITVNSNNPFPVIAGLLLGLVLMQSPRIAQQWERAIVLRLGPAAEWFIWPIPALVSPFAGVFYPVATLPGWMQAISKLLPPSYVFESLRAVVHGGSASCSDLAIGGALAVVDLVLACMLFRSVHRRALRSGLIARYAAETVT